MISVCVPYYRNPQMMLFHLANWNNWSPEIRRQIEFVIVDDGSPEPLSIPTLDLNLTTYTVEENIRWNFSGAKNLLATVSKTPWFLLHDIDYSFTESDMEKILALDITDPTKFYNFKCVSARTGKTKRKDAYPISSFLVHQVTFWRAGGHDEDFCGHYTCHDNGIFWRLTRDPGLAEQVLVDDPTMKYYTSFDVEDADTSEEQEGWSRDGSRNRELLGLKRQKIVPWSNISVRFRWHRTQKMRMK